MTAFEAGWDMCRRVKLASGVEECTLRPSLYETHAFLLVQSMARKGIVFRANISMEAGSVCVSLDAPETHARSYGFGPTVQEAVCIAVLAFRGFGPDAHQHTP